MAERTHGKRQISAVAAIVGSLALLAGSSLFAAASSAAGRDTPDPAASNARTTSCELGNGVQHVIEITFDNVHFFRDNPNVPSDLELMPHLLNFIEQNGTLLSNNHTPLIAHTANDTLTTYAGLYGDRQGMPVSNSYQTFNGDGTTDPAGSFAYWTDPVYDTASHPSTTHDTNPSMVYASSPPATHQTQPNAITPAPWVPFTRAGCDVGNVATANMELENTAADLPKVFGANSPEVQQLAADSDGYKDAETADYVGIAVHCAKGSALCSNAKATKYGQTTPSATAVADVLPDEPGGYDGFDALFGHRYVAPQLGAGTDNLSHDGYQVTNGSGNLVDLSGNQINGAFLTNHPGFPGFGSINASQTLAYMADMQEANVPVTYGYISDIHGNEHIPGLAACSGVPSALGSGSPCYIAQAQAYDQAFATFFARLAADGINKSNTVFLFSSDEGDHEAAANVGRALQPSPANCDGATVSGTTVTPDIYCNYPTGTFGELAGNLTGLLATEKANTTPFTLEADTAPEFYLRGQPSSDSPLVRTLEHDVAGLTANNPYSGNSNELITNYLADPTEEAILHMVNADPARTPTFSLFAKPDYYLSTGAPSCSASCVSQNNGFAWDHGDYAAEIDTNYLGIVGPNVANLGLDGSAAFDGPNSAGPSSGQETVPGNGTTGTWLDETDIRPTLMYLTGLKDDYTEDGRVVTEVLQHVDGDIGSKQAVDLGTCYKQMNSSVGELGTATLQAATRAIESTSPGDTRYTSMDQQLLALDQARDDLASEVKSELFNAEFNHGGLGDAEQLTDNCQAIIAQADHLAIVG